MSDAAETAHAVDYDIRKVLNALPHRYPLLLVDRVKVLELGERIHAVKGVTFNEQFFQGHFPGAPIMPGVLQIEAMAQAAAILGIETLEVAGTGKLVYFLGIESAKFRAPVTPGCLLDLEVHFTQKSSRTYKFHGRASVEGKTTCEVDFLAMITDPPA
ncbi:MAG: 3-hydroxyacyl-ACP dehydratase FabZ [Sphingomonadales bacterium]|nr:3-hydroxyacyl-ACP dehydratase FabZ [Sphingomonadales bacterium]MBD3772462.1 3-hydroxyacyl-ACP dehydratase FabZ [Paracoccaceae bacterium]